MPRLQAAELQKLGCELFAAVGVPAAEAELVADHLVESGLLGHDTHSVLRFPQYVDMVRQGVVRPGAPLEILSDTPATARVSGGWNFGPVTATWAMRLAMEKARRIGLGAVAVQQCNHVARLGRFASLAAREDLVALVAANGHGGDLAVAPLGGQARRLPTNPLCVALPTPHPWPILLDMTTSMISGGALRLCRNRGEPVPPGHLIDAQGRPTTDPEAYYGPPPGAILPLGFPLSGHKGFGLAVVVDVLAGALSGAGCSQAAPPATGNALFVAAIDIATFIRPEEFAAQVERFVGWLKSCPPAPGFAEVVLPGEKAWRTYQQRCQEGLEVDPQAWRQIAQLAAELEVELPVPSEG